MIRRLQLDFTEENYDQLQVVRALSGAKSNGEVISFGLALLRYFSTELRDGNAVVVNPKGEIIKNWQTCFCEATERKESKKGELRFLMSNQIAANFRGCFYFCAKIKSWYSRIFSVHEKNFCFWRSLRGRRAAF